MRDICPFCKKDPYEYVHNGCGLERVAITCCDLGVSLHGGDKRARQALRLMRDHSPRRKARARRIIDAMESGE